MGPLVPDIISSEFSLIVAIIIGIGFGFALEQAGFASTKKLVGLFYGNDFTVLRVFFTAGVTAAVGVIVLNHLGMLDVSIIYINPTYLWSALVGGAIMGGGFIIGGFCPGTSACAAATGRIDGWAFLGGSLLGILFFTEGYPLFENLYLAKYEGDLLIFEMTNISRELMGIIMVIVAVIAFVATQIIEDKVNGKTTVWNKRSIIKYTGIVAIPLALVFIVMISPTRTEIMNSRIESKIAAGECNPRLINSDKLAYELLHNYYLYNVIDVRSPEEYSAFHIPTAINIPLEELDQTANLSIIKQNLKTNIFYGANEQQGKRACMVAKYFGKSDNFALDISADEFNNQFYGDGLNEFPIDKDHLLLLNFRKETSLKLLQIEESVSSLGKPVVKKAKRVSGGCS